MSRISKRKRIYMCMASVMCMLLLLIPLPVSANNQGSILLKATVEDEAAVYNLSNTEFTMYQVGIYKKNSWVLETEYRITTSEECPERPIQMEKLCTEIWKKVCIFLSRYTQHKLAIKYIEVNLLS